MTPAELIEKTKDPTYLDSYRNSVTLDKNGKQVEKINNMFNDKEKSPGFESFYNESYTWRDLDYSGKEEFNWEKHRKDFQNIIYENARLQSAMDKESDINTQYAIQNFLYKHQIDTRKQITDIIRGASYDQDGKRQNKMVGTSGKFKKQQDQLIKDF